jgi:hypothetical protein
MLVRWTGYDESRNQWVRHSVLEEDVPTLVLAYDANPSIFVSRKSAPKRAQRVPRIWCLLLCVARTVPLELPRSTVHV